MKKSVKVIRPIDAASLVVYKEKKGRVQVLMGRRGNSAKFQPGYYVFPGGVKENGTTQLISSITSTKNRSKIWAYPIINQKHMRWR